MADTEATNEAENDKPIEYEEDAANGDEESEDEEEPVSDESSQDSDDTEEPSESEGKVDWGHIYVCWSSGPNIIEFL